MQVLCTLGHVNHGKTALVQALTQTTGALSPTVDLVFSKLDLPLGNFFSVVDVPGDPNYLDQVLVGLAGIDAFMLVVAADEGIMPQTRQHLEIARLMGVPMGVAVITKTDLADSDEWLELIQSELADLLGEFGFHNIPILAVSAQIGAGLAPLQKTLANLFAYLPPHQDLGKPFLPIDRIFVFKGVGVVVTGTLRGGRLSVGEMVNIQPLGMASRIRGLQSHHQRLDVAEMGTRVAVNLASVDRELLYHGCVLGYHLSPTRLVDVIYHHLPASPALLHHTEVKFFAGPLSTPARLWLIEAELASGGESHYAQLKFSDAVVLQKDTHFVLQYEGQIVGGGQILETHPKHRWRKHRAEVLERFRALENHDQAYLLAYDLQHERHPQRIEQYDPQILAEAESRFGLLRREDYILHPEVLLNLQSRAQTVLKAFHQQHPLLTGMDQKNFLRQLKVGDEMILPFLLADGAIQSVNNAFKLRDRGVQFTKNQQRQIENLLATFEADPANPPSFKDAAAEIGEALLKTLLREGLLVYLPPDVLLLPNTYLALVDYARRVLESGDVLTLGAIRDYLQTSRRIAMPFLDYLEKKRITRRDETGHHLYKANWEDLQNPI